MRRTVEEQVARIGGESHEPSTDEKFEVLADRHRRVAVSCLLERKSSVSADELIDDVIASTETDPAAVDDYRDRLRSKFHHVHLPMLHDVGIVEYRRESQAIEPRSVIHKLEPFLEWADLREAV